MLLLLQEEDDNFYTYSQLLTASQLKVTPTSSGFCMPLKPISVVNLVICSARYGDRVDELGHLLVHAFFLHQGTDQLAELFQRGALVAQHLAAQQIQRLDGVGAFVDHVDAVVAHKLLHAPLFDKAVAAKHLHAGIGGDVAVVGDEGFDDGGQQGDQLGSCRLAHFFIGVAVLFIQQQACKTLAARDRLPHRPSP
jgi:hypothetical protein